MKDGQGCGVWPPFRYQELDASGRAAVILGSHLTGCTPAGPAAPAVADAYPPGTRGKSSERPLGIGLRIATGLGSVTAKVDRLPVHQGLGIATDLGSIAPRSGMKDGDSVLVGNGRLLALPGRRPASYNAAHAL